jgi:hypothetical protein
MRWGKTQKEMSMQVESENKSFEDRVYEELYGNGTACGRGFTRKNGAALMAAMDTRSEDFNPQQLLASPAVNSAANTKWRRCAPSWKRR